MCSGEQQKRLVTSPLGVMMTKKNVVKSWARFEEFRFCCAWEEINDRFLFAFVSAKNEEKYTGDDYGVIEKNITKKNNFFRLHLRNYQELKCFSILKTSKPKIILQI